MKKEAQINVYYYQNFSVENNHFMNLFVRPSNRVFTRSKIFTIGILFPIYVSEQASLDLLLYSSFFGSKTKIKSFFFYKDFFSISIQLGMHFQSFCKKIEGNIFFQKKELCNLVLQLAVPF